MSVSLGKAFVLFKIGMVKAELKSQYGRFSSKNMVLQTWC